MDIVEFGLYVGLFVGLMIVVVGAHWLYQERTGRHGGRFILAIEAREPWPARTPLLPTYLRLILGGTTLAGAALIGLVLLAADS